MQSTGKRLESSESTYDKELNSSKNESCHFRRPSALTSFKRRQTALNSVWTASRWTFRLSYVNREGFREIVLAAWKSSLHRAPSASGLSARAVAVIAGVLPSSSVEES